jgi:hypothetical protein
MASRGGLNQPHNVTATCETPQPLSSSTSTRTPDVGRSTNQQITQSVLQQGRYMLLCYISNDVIVHMSSRPARACSLLPVWPWQPGQQTGCAFSTLRLTVLSAYIYIAGRWPVWGAGSRVGRRPGQEVCTRYRYRLHNSVGIKGPCD